MANKEEYYLRLNAKYDQTTIKKPWNFQRLNEIIDILKSYRAKKSQNNGQALLAKEKYYGGKYDLLDISGISKVILKPKWIDDDNIIFITPIEEFFDKIEEQHIATGHGGRDKILHNLKKECNIPRMAVEVYVELCKTCNMKKTHKNAGLVVKPIISKDINIRGQVDLIDFQSCADGNYKWLLFYQDHATKFIYLRPLENNKATDVAGELLKIFLEQGVPVILQSDNGREFTEALIKELVLLWPECKIVHGRPTHPKIQGSIESSAQDVEQMLRIWMEDNKSTRWSLGCYFVQWQKNTTYNRIIGKSPYKSLYGTEPKVGLRSMNLSSDLIDKISSEEDLERVNKNVCFDNLENFQNSDSDAIVAENIDSILQVTIHEETSNDLKIEQVEGNQMITEVMIPIKKEHVPKDDIIQDTSKSGNESSDTHTCSKCHKRVRDICGVVREKSNKDFGSQIICNLCDSEENIRTNRKKSYEGQMKAAEIMTKRSRFYSDIESGKYATSTIPKFDRGSLNKNN